MPVLGRKALQLTQCSVAGAEWSDGRCEVSIFADTVYWVAKIPDTHGLMYMVYLFHQGGGDRAVIGTKDPTAWDWFNGVHQAPKYDDDDPLHGQR